MKWKYRINSETKVETKSSKSHEKLGKRLEVSHIPETYSNAICEIRQRNLMQITVPHITQNQSMNCLDLFRTLFFQNYIYSFCFRLLSFLGFVDHCGHELLWMEVGGLYWHRLLGGWGMCCKGSLSWLGKSWIWIQLPAIIVLKDISLKNCRGTERRENRCFRKKKLGVTCYWLFRGE